MKQHYQKHIFCTFVLLLSFALNSEAVPAYPFPQTITQPDGSKITIQLKGDEFFRYQTTVDGYLLAQDEDGIFNYAYVDENGNIINTNVKASEIKKRTSTEKKLLQTLSNKIDVQQVSKKNSLLRSVPTRENTFRRSYPLQGSPKALVILVDFQDVKYVTPNPKEAFRRMLNEKNYTENKSTGSARDYFLDSSNEVFNPEFVVAGPYLLPQKMEYYGRNSGGDDVNPQQMVIDACKLADEDGVDFSEFDIDNDGYVDNIFIFYAGYNEAEYGPKNSIWPHRWTLANHNTKFDGKIIYDYACTSELRSNQGNEMCGIGTFVHEFGHVLGLPDYYATRNDANHHTLSSWNVMDVGSYLNNGKTPPSYSAYDRFYLNWLEPTELKTNNEISLEALNTSNTAYIVTENGNHNLNRKNPYPTEFFVLENRQNTGWDTYLPGHGLLITRINYNANDWRNNTVNNYPNIMGVDIIEADGIANNITLSGDVFPGTSNRQSYTFTLRSGTETNKLISEIKEQNQVISFFFSDTKPEISIEEDLIPFSTEQGTPSPSQEIVVNGKSLFGDIIIKFESGTHFEMKLQSAEKWGKSLSLLPVDSVVENTIIQIRYNPAEPSFDETHTDNILFGSKLFDTQSISIFGQSTRPVYVVPPVTSEASDISPYKFTANWQPVFDASGYYLTVFSFSDNVAYELTEGFDNGLTSPAGWTISAQRLDEENIGNINQAIKLSQPGEYIQTEKYIFPVTKLSFYISSTDNNRNQGNILVEGWNEDNWTEIENILIESHLNEIKSYTFKESDRYKQFRFTYNIAGKAAVIDDITVGFDQAVNYVLRNQYVTDTSYTIHNLLPENEYFYAVQASDKTLYPDNSVKYENITDFSDIMKMQTTTADNAPKEELRVFINRQNKTITLYLPDNELNEDIYIYNSSGKLVKIKKPTENYTTITGLYSGQLYAIKVGKRKVKTLLF
ncbi:M6 family metalloprotease domain-containing protein [Paludibacter sp. 221]|uniref:M6 family metalloprotease domain-containing protein n=1 Tax=Paludibacter sp. 221 TaxID=2302939 RepID=UPI0013D7C5FD|nr:M6 family metalloprotease domain-containing protein [Paludibacter sp. 221]